MLFSKLIIIVKFLNLVLKTEVVTIDFALATATAVAIITTKIIN